MPTIDGQVVPEDVERVREQILQAREQRRRVEAAFDAFTSGFRTRQLQKDFEALRVPPPSQDPVEIRASSSAAPEVTEPSVPATAFGMPPETIPPKGGRRRNAPVLAVVGVAVVGAAMFAVLGRQPGPEVAPPDSTAAPAASPPQASADTPAPDAKPPAAPIVESGVNVTLTTRRRVWLRVTLDGQRAFEREVPADQHIPLRADRSIVIRAGDAGAVAITRNGRDVGPLGRDGVVATREFNRDAASRR